MTTVLLDNHVLPWWSAEPDRLGSAASETPSSANELAVAAIWWFELAWLADRGRISPRPIAVW